MSQSYLIAPSSYCINQQTALRGLACLTEAGHQVDNSVVIARCCQHLAGTEAERFADVNSFVDLKTSGTIVMVIYGGYGAGRLLAEIDWQGLTARQQQDPLLLCGHNDFTTIQYGLLTQGNVISFNDSMLAANFGAEEMNALTEYHSRQALRNVQFTFEWQSEDPRCVAEDTLWGGNLAMIISLVGTPWMPAIKNDILVLEDINECPLRVERMLLQLYHAKIPAQQNAIILGSFSGSAPNDYDIGCNLDSIYDFLRARLSMPLICSLDFGHEQRTVTLPLGAGTMLKNDKSGIQLTLSGHPVLKS